MAKITLEFGSFGDGILNQKETFDEEELKEMSKRICKPCRELHYCPYGPLVENFPLPKQLRKEAIEHNEYLKGVLKNNEFSNGEKLDKERRRRFEESVNSFDPNSYPEKENKTIKCMSCTEFGHLCPVFFMNEGFTETKYERSQNRNIPRDMLIRVVRRDNSMCQECGKALFDRDIEIDHIIPISKGGATNEGNLQVLCFDCNRSKSNKVKNIFHDEAKKKYGEAIDSPIEESASNYLSMLNKLWKRLLGN